MKLEKILDQLTREIAGNPDSINQALRCLIDFAGDQVGVLDKPDAIDLAAYLNKRKSHLSSISDDAKADVADGLDDGDRVVGHHWALQCTLITPMVLNSKRLKQDIPMIFEQYLEPSPRLNRTFGAV